MNVVGMISGTSADGIEVAVVQISGAPPRLSWRLLAHEHVAFRPELRAEIFACFRPETGSVDRLCRLNFALGRAFAGAALHGIAAANLRPDQVDLIGSHGQTLWHIPDGPDASTLQLGEPAVIAEVTGIPTIANLRTRDMAAGGQGAPLVAYVDYLLLSHPDLARTAQNIGGIANVTYLPPLSETQSANTSGGAMAFDTGPGNMLIDYAASQATSGAWYYDHDGALAAQGEVHTGLLAELLAEPFLRQRPPKTTGRELFGAQFGAQAWERAKALGLADADVLATLTTFTARSIAQAYHDFLPRFPAEVIVSGGGAQNPTLMAMLRQELRPARVITSDDAGLPTEAKEAIAFAVLAYETWHGRPGNLPVATGALHPVTLGCITPGAVSAPPLPREQGDLPTTEMRNQATERIDVVPALEMVRLMNAEDQRIAQAVAAELPAIADAIGRIAERMRGGGRLIYAGAGTSGRLAVLDAAECPPTFSTPPDLVVALMAGGETALTHSVEGAEDDPAAGEAEVVRLNCGAADSLVGLAASGRTPYVLGAMAEARRRGALVVGLTCTLPSPMAELADILIAPIVGPEVITGSTRLKAGTAQKMVLNMLSTGVMIQLGKTFGNLMVDVQPTNSKLRARARRIVAEACGVSAEESAALLAAAGGDVKVAILVGLSGVAPEEARERLRRADGAVRRALEGGAMPDGPDHRS